jgi:hypothetical protein
MNKLYKDILKAFIKTIASLSFIIIIPIILFILLFTFYFMLSDDERSFSLSHNRYSESIRLSSHIYGFLSVRNKLQIIILDKNENEICKYEMIGSQDDYFYFKLNNDTLYLASDYNSAFKEIIKNKAHTFIVFNKIAGKGYLKFPLRGKY